MVEYALFILSHGEQDASMLLACLPLVAHCSGLAHDLGKATADTQALLRHGIREPAARHEYVSAWALEALLELPADTSVDALLAADLPAWDRLRPPPGAFRFTTLADAVVWATLTHHRLPARDAATGGPCSSAFRRNPSAAPPAWAPPLAHPDALRALGSVCDDVRTTLRSGAGALDAPAAKAGVWALAWIARALLILADHAVSAEKAPAKRSPVPWDCAVWANAARRATSRSARAKRHAENTPKQTLQYHLSAVGDVAQALAAEVVPWLRDAHAPLPHAAIDAPAGAAGGRYAWQITALAALDQWRDQHPETAPRLLLTVAPTGSGKTRFHALAVRALNRAPVRFSVALPLRQLTYQTAHAIASEIPGLHAHQVLCVTGEHAHVADALLIGDGSSAPGPSEEDADGNALTYPAPTAHPLAIADIPVSLPAPLTCVLAVQAPASEQILASPVLVSTIDQLLHAADPTAQGAHGVALLRVFSGDLVLDEIDAYPADRMQSVFKLISLAALAGRNVLCSSATLSGPLAGACARAFAQGLERRGALLGRVPQLAGGHVGVVDGAGQLRTFALDSDGHDALEHALRHHAAGVAPRGAAAALLPLASRTVAEWLSAVAQCVQSAHADLAWTAAGTARKHSAGVIRVAHIRDALCVAQALLTLLPAAFPYRLCVLHGQMPYAWRAHIEGRLGAALNRKGQHPYASYLADPDLAACDGPLIVVATSVIESGSDYCFDWAIADAWSWHSFHQLRGRVMRHRPADAADRVFVPTWSIKHCRQSEAAVRSTVIAPYTRPGNWPRTRDGAADAPSQAALLGLTACASAAGAGSFLEYDDAHAAAHFARVHFDAGIRPEELTDAYYLESRLRDRPSWRMERWAAIPTDQGNWALFVYCAHRRRWDAARTHAPVRTRCIPEEAPMLWPPLLRPEGAQSSAMCEAWSVHAPTLGKGGETTFHGRWGFARSR